FLPGPAADEAQPIQRREIEAAAELRQSSEIREMIDLGIAVYGKIAKRAETASPARDRQVEIDRRLSFALRQRIGRGCALPGATAGQVLGGSAERQCRGRIAGG